MSLINAPGFIVDTNVGKLAKWLRMMGYDTRFFNGSDDSEMIAAALPATESTGGEHTGRQ